MSQKFREVFCQTLLPASLNYRYLRTEASTMFGSKANSVALRSRSSLVPFRGSNPNAAEVSAAAYSVLQNGTTGSLCVPGARNARRSDSEASTALLRTPTGKKKRKPWKKNLGLSRHLAANFYVIVTQLNILSNATCTALGDSHLHYLCQSRFSIFRVGI